jgi:hypothetical protein
MIITETQLRQIIKEELLHEIILRDFETALLKEDLKGALKDVVQRYGKKAVMAALAGSMALGAVGGLGQADAPDAPADPAASVADDTPEELQGGDDQDVFDAAPHELTMKLGTHGPQTRPQDEWTGAEKTMRIRTHDAESAAAANRAMSRRSR